MHSRLGLTENCLMSNCPRACEINKSNVNPSITLARGDVSVIGLKSSSMTLRGITWGGGVTIDSLRIMGTHPSSIELL